MPEAEPGSRASVRRAYSSLAGRPLRDRLRESEAYELLLLLIVASLVFAQAAPDSDWAHLASVVIQGSTLLVALWSSQVSRHALLAATVVVAAGLIASTIALAGAGEELSRALVRLVNVMLVALAPLAIAGAVVRSVVGRRMVTLQSVLGVICIYLLIGMFFGFAYGAIDAIGSGSFFASHANADNADFVYFSFSTLTTVGYGDLTAATELGRALALIEALVGQLYLVTIVAVFVGNLAVGRERLRAGGD
jgi:hypothetical protein